MIFFKKIIIIDFIFNIEMIENLTLKFFLFILSFYVVCDFIEVTQNTPVYGCSEVFFLIELGFFIVYFFLILLKK